MGAEERQKGEASSSSENHSEAVEAARYAEDAFSTMSCAGSAASSASDAFSHISIEPTTAASTEASAPAAVE